MIRQFSAGIVTYIQNGSTIEYLLLHYPNGYWDLPKGKIEKGESKEEAALRELYEETGLSAHIKPGFETELSYFFKQGGEPVHKDVYFFVGETNKKEIRLSPEHVGYVWLPFEKAFKQLTYQNAKDTLAKAQEFIAALT